MAVTEQVPRARALAPSDLFAVDDLLGDDERLIRDTVRAFVRDRALAVIPEHFESGTFPRELIPGVAELGLLGMHLRGYGCAGTSATAYGVAAEELEAGDSGLRSFVSVQGSLAMFPIWAYGSEEQKNSLAARDGRRSRHRLLRIDRAGRGFGSRLDAYGRAARRC